MGAGRKSQTFLVGERSQQTPKCSSTPNCSITARNLRKKELGGVILGCTHSTMNECISKQLFGLPSVHISYVKRIEPGLPLFLFNYSDRNLHGVFEATSHGKMNIDPYGWTANGSETTDFPAQVRVRIRKKCRPLQEKQYKPIISTNYYTTDHFWFELDHAQASALISMFEASPSSASRIPSSTSMRTPPNTIPSRIETGLPPKNMSSWKSLFTTKNDNEPRNENESVIQKKACSWRGLFDTACEKKVLNEYEGSTPSFSDMDCSSLAQSETFAIEESQNREVYNKEVVEDEEQRIANKLQQIALCGEYSKSHTNCYGQGNVVPLAANDIASRNDYSLESSTVSLKDFQEILVKTRDLQSKYDQLVQEIGELKAYSRHQLQNTYLLENDLTESYFQIQQLKSRVQYLEHQVTPYQSCTDESLDDLNYIDRILEECFDEQTAPGFS